MVLVFPTSIVFAKGIVFLGILYYMQTPAKNATFLQGFKKIKFLLREDWIKLLRTFLL